MRRNPEEGPKPRPETNEGGNGEKDNTEKNEWEEMTDEERKNLIWPNSIHGQGTEEEF